MATDLRSQETIRYPARSNSSWIVVRVKNWRCVLASYQYVVRAETAETIAGEPCGESAALETAASDHDRRLAELTARCTDAERARREAESGAAELRAQLSAAQTQLAASNPIGPALTAALEARDLLVTQRQMRCLKRSIRGLLPRGAKVLVVSKGDDELLDLDECAASHFPQAGDGTYAGHYPGDSAEAIAHLEALREAGAEYLLFPPTARWWLEHYRPLAEHLHARYEAIVDMDAAGLLFALSPDPQRANPTV